MNKLVINAVNSVALLGHVTNDFNNFRREQIRPALKPEFATLYSAEIPHGKWFKLLGEDLPKRIRDIKETSKLGQVVAGPYRKRNFHNDRQVTTGKYFPRNPSSRKDFSMERPAKATNQKERTLPTREEILEELERIKTSVSNFSHFLPTIEAYLTAECKGLRAGRVAQFYDEYWENFMRDQQILQDILGAKIDCVEAPEQHN